MDEQIKELNLIIDAQLQEIDYLKGLLKEVLDAVENLIKKST